MGDVIDFGRRTQSREVPGLGACLLREPTSAMDRRFVDWSDEDHRSLANRVAAALLARPSLSPEAVDALEPDTRTALLDIVVDLLGGAGRSIDPSLRSDDRVLVALAERRKGHVAAVVELQQALEVVASPGDAVRRAVEGWTNGITAALRTLRTKLAVAAQTLEADLGRPIALITDGMILGPAIALAVQARVRPQAVTDALEDAVLDPQVLLVVRELVVPELRPSAQAQLAVALDALAEPPRAWFAAAPLLLCALEGELWAAATAQGVIDADRRLKSPERPARVQRRLATSAGHLLQPQAGMAIDARLARFIDRCVFDGDGHDVRHGRAQDAHREKALVALFALICWTHPSVDAVPRRAIAERLDRAAPPALTA